MAKNKVIAGDYLDQKIFIMKGIAKIQPKGWAAFLHSKYIPLDKSTIENYEVENEEEKKSALNMAGRGLVGGLLLGPAGLLAGVLTTKKKGTYLIGIKFIDGKKSLLEVDKKIYKTIIEKIDIADIKAKYK